jgi:hypothetical protein
MPKSVKAARVLMFVVAGITLMMTVGFLGTVGVTSTALGYAVWGAWPGAASLALALRITSGGTWALRAIIALQVVYLLLSLARLGAGDPRGLVNLAFPIAILVLVTRKAARDHFRTPDPALVY